MQRFPDWPQRMTQAIEQRRRMPYAWGSNDCALCAADLVHAMTGEDFGAAFRGRYSDEAGARQILAELGHESLRNLVDAFLPRGTGRAKRGDVVLQPHPAGDFLAIVWGGGVVGPGERGLTLAPRAPGSIFWSVG